MLTNGRRCDEELDAFGLLACQRYNFGNSDNWFFSFRAGLRGVGSRLDGVNRHSVALHSWIPPETIHQREHHIATMLFCMDSALECLVFALNALGQAVDRSGFREVSSRKALAGISPKDVVGGLRPPLSGYAKLFPTVQKTWQGQASLIQQVCDNHDVSKHRQGTFWGGTLRQDPPTGFFEMLGLADDDAARVVLAPMKEVLVPKDPKAPMNELAPELTSWSRIDDLERKFVSLVVESVCSANTDARANITLSHSELRPESPDAV